MDITVNTLGTAIRRQRKARKMTQRQLAEAIGVGERFIVELEKGKETCHLGKTFQALQAVGLTFSVMPTEGYHRPAVTPDAIADVNRSVATSDQALLTVLELLKGTVPLRKWPREIARALAGAITEPHTNPEEDEKAIFLKAHLFAGLPVPFKKPGRAVDAVAERLRADLAGLVDCGAATYLVNESDLQKMVAA